MQPVKYLALLLLIFHLLSGCASRPETAEELPSDTAGGGINILETCLRNISVASPDTLRAALRLLDESDAGKSETGVEYAYIASKLLRVVYPVIGRTIPKPEVPARSIFPEIFSQIEAGRYPKVKQEETSFLTVLTAPAVVLYSADKAIESQSLENINQAIRMNETSVLPVYLRGYINERRSMYEAALSDYEKALQKDPSCYPAEIGTARIYQATGRNAAAAEIMDLLTAQYPYSVDILKAASEARFSIEDYSGALEYSSAALRINPDDPEILLLRADIFLEQGNIQQARRLIDVLERMGHESIDFYLIKSELEKSTGDYLSALNTLEKARKRYPDSRSIEEAYGEVLVLTGRRDEARDILTGSGESGDTGSEGLMILIEDAIEIEDWNAAAEYARRLESADGSLKAGIAVWSVWYNSKDYLRALQVAEDLYSRYTGESDAALVYIKTLIKLDRRLQAERIINTRLAAEANAIRKSELFYLKSLILDDDQERLQSLRSALFEDLQNIDALVGISRLYTKMGDIRKAYRYIRQASSISPGNEEVIREMNNIESMLE